MPSQTTKYAIPYATAADKVGDYPATGKQNAEKIEDLLTTAETALKNRIHAGKIVGPKVNANGVSEVTITLPATIDPAAYIPQVSLMGARGSVDRLAVTVTDLTATTLKVAVKNMTVAADAAATYHITWTLTQL